ncbi:MAG: aminotransferase class III-fold pyridoxal phosphate-dependent enzyme [Thiotrichaceae bacterium]
MTASATQKFKLVLNRWSQVLRVPTTMSPQLKFLSGQYPEITAILEEPVTGEGGVVIPDTDYLQRLRTLCDQHDWLLILDEIQTGIGRTGTWLACQQANVLPDVVTLAKGLGGGVPIGACLAQGKVATILQPGTHGSTFGGNPLACRVGLTVIQTIEQDNLLARIQALSLRFQTGFTEALHNVAAVQAIRVKGLMIGIELSHPCRELMQQALNAGVVLNVTADKVVRLLPPFILTDAQADEIIATTSRVIQQFSHSKENA